MAQCRSLRSALSALAIGALLTLTACGGAGTAAPSSSDPSSTPTPTIDTRPTPASSTAPARNIPIPELPQAATQNTKEGFKAFVEHYIALLDYAYQTGDTKPALAAADPGCTMCGVAIKDVDGTAQDGGWIVGGKLSMSDLATFGAPDINGVWDASVTLNQAQITTVSKTGAVSSPAPPNSAHLLASSQFVSGKWMMLDLGLPRGSRG